MAITDYLSRSDIEAAVKACKDKFDYKIFFSMAGLKSKSDDDVRKVFDVIDTDNSGTIDKDELKLFMQKFSPNARALTDAETDAFLQALDTDGDQKIGVDGFLALVKA